MIASRTAFEPTGFITAPPWIGRSVSSSAGASSSPVPYGGAWKLKIARPMSGTWLATASILAASSGSGASRKVSHGVGLVQPMEISENPSRSSSLPSAKLTHGDCSMMSSISQMSSLPPLRMHGISPPRSLPSAMSSHRSRDWVISTVNLRSTAPSSLLSTCSSSGLTMAG